MRAAWALLLALALGGCTLFTPKPASPPTTETMPPSAPPASSPRAVVGPPILDEPPATPTPPTGATPDPAATLPPSPTPPTPTAPTPAPTAQPTPAPASAPPSPTPRPAPADGGVVVFLEGADAGPARLGTYVASYDLDPEGGFVRMDVRGVPEATLTIGSLFRVRNDDAAARTVELTASRVESAFVEAYAIELVAPDGVARATLDLRVPAPEAVVTLPPGETWDARLTLTLASGAGNDTSFSVTEVRAALLSP